MIGGFVGVIAILQATAGAPEVTVYNQGFALVKEVRSFALKSGRQTVEVEDVPSEIEANSVGIRRLGDESALQVLEQNYRYDLINPIGILSKAVGGLIKLHRTLPNGHRETIVGTLLSAPTAIVPGPRGQFMETYDGMVLRTEDGHILLDPQGEIEVPAIPAGMISRPSLVWDVDSRSAGPAKIELSYLTHGMVWNADYVLTLDGTGTADLRGWVTMTNNCGVAFKDARLKLLAGDVHVVVQAPESRAMGMRMPKGEVENRPSFQEESLFEYHLYTLQRPATLKDKEIKQLSLLEAHGVKVAKRLIVDSMRDYGMYYPGEGEVGTGMLKPQVRIEFVNSKENGLGMPLPKGNFKLYQRDKSGSEQMLGEDQIDHTPKDEKISLVVGRAFDVVAERKRTNFERTGPTSFRETFIIEVRNHKAVPEPVTVLERHFGDWKIEKKSMDFTKLDSTTMQFLVSLKAGESKTIEYTVHTQW